jgi:type II secretory pathway pseudopilin PulG
MASRMRSCRQAGFTYVAMLIGVAVIGIGLAATGEVWSQSARRDKEQELLFIGQEFREAFERYHRESPGSMPRYPKTLQDLLQDSRHVTVKRHLRRIYRDPMTGRDEWGLVMAPEGGIMGVHSLSTERPLKSGNFSRGENDAFKQAQRYSDWIFAHEAAPPKPAAPPPAAK